MLVRGPWRRSMRGDGEPSAREESKTRLSLRGSFVAQSDRRANPGAGGIGRGAGGRRSIARRISKIDVASAEIVYSCEERAGTYEDHSGERLVVVGCLRECDLARTPRAGGRAVSFIPGLA